jgi:hypothetical protein
MCITQNSKIRRITDSTSVVGTDIAKKIHVARASDVRGMGCTLPRCGDKISRELHDVVCLCRHDTSDSIRNLGTNLPCEIMHRD